MDLLHKIFHPNKMNMCIMMNFFRIFHALFLFSFATHMLDFSPPLGAENVSDKHVDF